MKATYYKTVKTTEMKFCHRLYCCTKLIHGRPKKNKSLAIFISYVRLMSCQKLLK